MNETAFSSEVLKNFSSDIVAVIAVVEVLLFSFSSAAWWMKWMCSSRAESNTISFVTL